MAAIDFPASPTVGDTYGAPGGVTWLWDGTAWVIVGGDGGGAMAGVVAFARVTASQSLITAVVDLNGLSVTFQANPTHRYRTTVSILFFGTVTNDPVNLTIADAANSTKGTGAGSVHPGTASYSVSLQAVAVETGLSGSVTRKARFQRAAGSGNITMQAAGTFPAFILVEDLGPVTGGSTAGGGWVDFTPQWTNVTPGSGATNVGKYAYNPARTSMDVVIKLILGSSPAMGSSPSFTVPDGRQVLNILDNAANFGDVRIMTPGGFIGVLRMQASRTQLEPVASYVNVAPPSYVGHGTISANFPLVWEAGSTLMIVATIPLEPI